MRRGMIVATILAGLVVLGGGWYWWSHRGPAPQSAQTPATGSAQQHPGGDLASANNAVPSPDAGIRATGDSDQGAIDVSSEPVEEHPLAVVRLINPNDPSAPPYELRTGSAATDNAQEPNPTDGVAIPDQTAGTGGASVAAPQTEGSADPDGDGLTTDQERQLNTNPNNRDTDGDALTDGDEVHTLRTDPRRSDTDGDGLKDGEERARWKSDPLNPDTDGDGYPDGVEVKGGYNPSGPGKL